MPQIVTILYASIALDKDGNFSQLIAGPGTYDHVKAVGEAAMKLTGGTSLVIPVPVPSHSEALRLLAVTPMTRAEDAPQITAKWWSSGYQLMNDLMVGSVSTSANGERIELDLVLNLGTSLLEIYQSQSRFFSCVYSRTL